MTHYWARSPLIKDGKIVALWDAASQQYVPYRAEIAESEKHIASFREFIKDAGLFDGEYTIQHDGTGPRWISEKTQGAWIAWLYMHSKLEDQQRNADGKAD